MTIALMATHSLLTEGAKRFALLPLAGPAPRASEPAKYELTPTERLKEGMEWHSRGQTCCCCAGMAARMLEHFHCWLAIISSVRLPAPIAAVSLRHCHGRDSCRALALATLTRIAMPISTVNHLLRWPTGGITFGARQSEHPSRRSPPRLVHIFAAFEFRFSMAAKESNNTHIQVPSSSCTFHCR